MNQSYCITSYYTSYFFCLSFFLWDYQSIVWQLFLQGFWLGEKSITLRNWWGRIKGIEGTRGRERGVRWGRREATNMDVTVRDTGGHSQYSLTRFTGWCPNRAGIYTRDSGQRLERLSSQRRALIHLFFHPFFPLILDWPFIPVSKDARYQTYKILLRPYWTSPRSIQRWNGSHRIWDSFYSSKKFYWSSSQCSIRAVGRTEFCSLFHYMEACWNHSWKGISDNAMNVYGSECLGFLAVLLFAVFEVYATV